MALNRQNHNRKGGLLALKQAVLYQGQLFKRFCFFTSTKVIHAHYLILSLKMDIHLYGQLGCPFVNVQSEYSTTGSAKSKSD